MGVAWGWVETIERELEYAESAYWINREDRQTLLMLNYNCHALAPLKMKRILFTVTAIIAIAPTNAFASARPVPMRGSMCPMGYQQAPMSGPCTPINQYTKEAVPMSGNMCMNGEQSYGYCLKPLN